MSDDFSQAPNIITGSIAEFASSALFVTKSDPSSPISILEVKDKAGVILFHQYESMFKQLNVAIQEGTIGGGGGDGDSNAEYVVMTATGSLANERVLTAGTGIGLTDAGAGAAVTLSADDNTVAMISGSTFSGVTKHDSGLSGSLTALIDGSPYLRQLGGISITTQSNGSIIISGSEGLAGPPGTSLWTEVSADEMSTTSSVFIEGIALELGDGTGQQSLTMNSVDGATKNTISLQTTGTNDWVLLEKISKNLEFSRYVGGVKQDTLVIDNASGLWTFPNSVYVEGSVFRLGDGIVQQTLELEGPGGVSQNSIHFQSTGTLDWDFYQNASKGLQIDRYIGGGGQDSVIADNDDGGWTFPKFVIATTGFSGSLTQLSDGTSYLVAGDNITIASESNGQVTVSSTATGGEGADPGASYVVMGLTASLDNERSLTAGTGLDLADGGAGAAATLSIDNDVVATISGSTFEGATLHNTGLSGSLTQLIDGTSYLVAGDNVTISSESNGQVTVNSTATGGDGADPGASYILMGNTASLANERALVGGTGIDLTDGGADGAATLAIDNDVVATISGSTFTGATLHNSGLSGSLTQLIDGTSYLVGGANITVASESNGQVTISAAGVSGPDAFVGSVIDFSTTASIVHTYTNSGLLSLTAINHTFDKTVMLAVGSTTGSSDVSFSSDFRVISGSGYLATSGTINLLTMYCRDTSTPIINVVINQEE